MSTTFPAPQIPNITQLQQWCNRLKSQSSHPQSSLLRTVMYGAPYRRTISSREQLTSPNFNRAVYIMMLYFSQTSLSYSYIDVILFTNISRLMMLYLSQTSLSYSHIDVMLFTKISSNEDFMQHFFVLFVGQDVA